MICQLVLEYFQLQLSDILFFLEAFGLFGIFWPSKGLTAFLRPKNPKKASGLQKKPNVFKLQLKILQKKLTHHEKMPAFFLSLVPYHIDAHSSMILYISLGHYLCTSLYTFLYTMFCQFWNIFSIPLIVLHILVLILLFDISLHFPSNYLYSRYSMLFQRFSFLSKLSTVPVLIPIGKTYF